MPLAHVSVPASDVQKSKAFYLQALQPLGYQIYKEFDVAVGMGPKYAAPDFWVHKAPEQKDGEKAVSNVHVAFCGKSKKAVEAFYQAALNAGGKDNGPPGERDYVKGYFAAFVLDPDGNNIECMYWNPWWLMAMNQAPKLLCVGAVLLAWYSGKMGWKAF